MIFLKICLQKRHGNFPKNEKKNYDWLCLCCGPMSRRAVQRHNFLTIQAMPIKLAVKIVRHRLTDAVYAHARFDDDLDLDARSQRVGEGPKKLALN